DKEKNRLAESEKDYRMIVANHQNAQQQLQEKQEENRWDGLEPYGVLLETKQTLETEVTQLRSSRSRLIQLKEKLQKQETLTASIQKEQAEREKSLADIQNTFDTELAILQSNLEKIPED